MNGIIILALRKSAYYQAAFNLALSIKHYNNNINITLVSDGGHTSHWRAENYSVFDWIKEISPEHYTDQYGFSPALAKINIFKYSSYDHSLYIDADSICLQDLQPLLDNLIAKKGLFYSNVLGEGGIKDDILYQAWATNEKLWEYFNLKEEQKVYTFNTTWFYFNKDSDNLMQSVLYNYNRGFDRNDLKNKWGGTLPDELFFYGTMAQKEINPKVDFSVCFFGDTVSNKNLDEIQTQHYLFTLFGGRTTIRLIYKEWYDRLMNMYCRTNGLMHYFKAHGILQGKHVLNK